MEKSALLDLALEKLMGDMDDMEGSSAMEHSMEECPDPLTCKMHDSELGEPLAKADGPAGVEIEVKKLGPGMPSLDGAKEEGPAEEGLAPDEIEKLRDLLK